ncbi:hypothetical protein EVG20_g11425 [Dentipellis fragilis]|uniref:Chromo domain-containing protein n=1 Tax=Dentipellis fragilis TaxID=205917 RepID=A0A4Y9XKS4_9AGAM|nr:hypothetical protein EVG20_g11425 [Dentipellis fragilis]
MHGVFDKLQITSALSTAYHPQTDGESEHFNQEFEQYLHAFCNYNQDNWVKWIPFAEFSHNHRSHSTTGQSPFEMLLSYIPVAIPSVKTSSPVPMVEECFRHMDQIQEDLQASLQPGVHYQKDDKVWLDGKNVRTTRPKAKLAAKYLGPFKITDIIGLVTCQLKLPLIWCIHPVFHASLLSPYKETDTHDLNFSIPALDLVEGKEEYEVEKVLNTRLTPNKCGIEYLVKWTDYPDFENQWRSRTVLSNATRAITDFYKRHPRASRLPNLRGLLYLDPVHAHHMLQEKVCLRERVMSRIALYLIAFLDSFHSNNATKYRAPIPSIEHHDQAP